MPAIKGAEQRERGISPGSSTLDSHSAKRGERADFEIGMMERRGETSNRKRRFDRIIVRFFGPSETNMGAHRYGLPIRY